MNTTTTHKVYPGLTCNSIELFNDGRGLKAFEGGRVKAFHELSFYHIQTIREAVESDPVAKEELLKMHPDSEIKRIEQYAICNFSGLDHDPDISNGVLQQGEYWECPKRGVCPAEGKLCKPLMYKSRVVSALDIKMIKLIATDKTNEVIAEELFLPMGTYNLFKQKLYEKLGVNTKQEVALIGVALNIIQAVL